jgi:hypothetical protein
MRMLSPVMFFRGIGGRLKVLPADGFEVRPEHGIETLVVQQIGLDVRWVNAVDPNTIRS